MRATIAVVGLLALGLLAGCGDSSGPKRNRVSGSATFDGKPIPYGEVLFTPDDAKKNSGAQGIAPIRDGKFDTSAAGARGTAAGRRWSASPA